MVVIDYFERFLLFFIYEQSQIYGKANKDKNLLYEICQNVLIVGNISIVKKGYRFIFIPAGNVQVLICI
jgi:hypothetical protein